MTGYSEIKLNLDVPEGMYLEVVEHQEEKYRSHAFSVDLKSILDDKLLEREYICFSPGNIVIDFADLTSDRIRTAADRALFTYNTRLEREVARKFNKLFIGRIR